MKPKTWIRIVATALSAAFPVCAQNTTEEQQVHKHVHFEHYTTKDLVTLGGTASSAFGINNRGHVSGQGNLPGNANEHAFLYSHGKKTDLGTLGGPGLNSTVGTLNDRDEVVAMPRTALRTQLVRSCKN